MIENYIEYIPSDNTIQESTMLTLQDVRELFNKEFDVLTKKFSTSELTIQEASSNSSKEVNSPGIYVYWHPKHGVLKVGKSQSNSKKRALEHIRDDTRKDDISIKELSKEKETVLLLLNIVDSKDLHWLLSLEAFLELKTTPSIPAGRIG